MNSLQKEFLPSGMGFISDVLFRQGQNTTSLKEVLPGSYAFTFGEYSVAYPETNTFTIPTEERSKSADDFHISLLHEASHCYVWETLIPDLYPKTGRTLTLVNLRESMAYGLINTGPRKLALLKEAKIATGKLGEPTCWYDPDRDREVVEKALEKSCRYIARLRTNADLEAYFARQVKLKSRATSRYGAVSEIQAWTTTVLILNTFNQRGIELFSGSRGDLTDIVEGSLKGYQSYHEGISNDPVKISIAGSAHHPTAKVLSKFKAS